MPYTFLSFQYECYITILVLTLYAALVISHIFVKACIVIISLKGDFTESSKLSMFNICNVAKLRNS